MRAAAAMASGAGDGPGKCQQVWCPVCALAALVNGEQHPLLTVIAEHSVALLTLIRTMAGDGSTQRGPDEPPTPDDDGPDAARPRRVATNTYRSASRNEPGPADDPV